MFFSSVCFTAEVCSFVGALFFSLPEFQMCNKVCPASKLILQLCVIVLAVAQVYFTALNCNFTVVWCVFWSGPM